MKMMLIGAAAASLSCAPAAAQSVFADDLSKCIVEKAKPEDRTLLIRWLFTAMAAHPDVQAMSKVPPAYRSEVSAAAGSLMERLITIDCRSQSVAAIRAHGPGVIEQSFKLLGEVAMRDFMTNRDVNSAIELIGSGIDNSRFEKLFAEAGLTLTK